MSWVAPIVEFLAENWRTIAILMGLAVLGTTAYTVAQSVVQAQPAFQQAIQISTYAIPMMVYVMTFQMIMQMFNMIRGLFSKMGG